MRVVFDYKLANYYGVVERIIFRFLLHGIKDAQELSKALPIFSDAVIANSLKKLINNQIIKIDTETGIMSISDPLIALTEKCLEEKYELSEENVAAREIAEKGCILLEGQSKEAIKAKEAILCELLPGIKLELYINSLDFAIKGDQYGKTDLD